MNDMIRSAQDSLKEAQQKAGKLGQKARDQFNETKGRLKQANDDFDYSEDDEAL
jgi:hypothetical protein